MVAHGDLVDKGDTGGRMATWRDREGLVQHEGQQGFFACSGNAAGFGKCGMAECCQVRKKGDEGGQPRPEGIARWVGKAGSAQVCALQYGKPAGQHKN